MPTLDSARYHHLNNAVPEQTAGSGWNAGETPAPQSLPNPPIRD